MAAGLPVITSDQAGAAELIEHTNDGFILPLDRWLDGAVAILRSGSSPKSIGASARNTARRHSWSSVVSAVEKVYRDALER